MKKNKLNTCIDWVLCAAVAICLLMMGFCAGCGDYLVAASFAMNVVCMVLLAVTRKEMRDGK